MDGQKGAVAMTSGKEQWWKNDRDRAAALEGADAVIVYRSSPSDLATDLLYELRRCKRHSDAVTQFGVALVERLSLVEKVTLLRALAGEIDKDASAKEVVVGLLQEESDEMRPDIYIATDKRDRDGQVLRWIKGICRPFLGKRVRLTIEEDR